MTEPDRAPTDDDFGRLWDELDAGVTPDGSVDLERDFARRSALEEARGRVAKTRAALALLDEPGPAPDIAGPVIARLRRREPAPALRPWLWLAPIAQVAIAIAAVAWATPGLLVALGRWGGLWAVAPTLVSPIDAALLWSAAALDRVGGLGQGLLDVGLDPLAGGLWIGACLAAGSLAWLIGNGVLLTGRAARR